MRPNPVSPLAPRPTADIRTVPSAPPLTRCVTPSSPLEDSAQHRTPPRCARATVAALPSMKRTNVARVVADRDERAAHADARGGRSLFVAQALHDRRRDPASAPPQRPADAPVSNDIAGFGRLAQGSAPGARLSWPGATVGGFIFVSPDIALVGWQTQLCGAPAPGLPCGGPERGCPDKEHASPTAKKLDS